MILDDKFLFIIVLLFFITPKWELCCEDENIGELQVSYGILVLVIVLWWLKE